MMTKQEKRAPESFQRRVTRQHRAAVVLLVDGSASMQSMVTYEGRPLSGGEVAAISANAIVKELICKAKASDEIRDYYDVMIVIYNGNGVCSIFGNQKGDNNFKSIAQIATMGPSQSPLSLEAITPFNSDNEELRNTKLIIEPKGDTPMHEALNFVHEELKKWCEKPENRQSIPPIVINISDGHTTDSSLEDIIEQAEEIKNISTKDGATLLINIFLSDSTEKMIFPTESELEQSPNEFYRAMGQAASIMPAIFEPALREMRGDDIADKPQTGYRAVGFAISVEDMIAMMNIGTLVTTK